MKSQRLKDINSLECLVSPSDFSLGHLIADLKAGFEGVRCGADTDTYVRFDRGQHYERQMRRNVLGDAPSHTCNEIGSAPLTTFAMLVYNPLDDTFPSRSLVRRRAVIPPGISICEMDGALHSKNKTMVVGPWLGNKRACEFKRYHDLVVTHSKCHATMCLLLSLPEDENVTIPDEFDVPADVSLTFQLAGDCCRVGQSMSPSRATESWVLARIEQVHLLRIAKRIACRWRFLRGHLFGT